jgi:hypothetical protein
MFPDAAKPLDIDAHLLTKALQPLSPAAIDELKHIQGYDVTAWNEAEVRANVIDPILKILGYDKGSIFSVDLEHHITFLGKHRKPDYKVNLWNTDFWLIEAKKPDTANAEFGYDDFSQALEYSIHPTINAALVVLCDGVKIEIFDREVDVDKPLLRVPRTALVEQFDCIRALLEPMQIWYFQKRRIARLLDRVFDREFIPDRLEEFSELIRSQLARKRQRVAQNFQKTIHSDSDEQRKRAESATLIELTQFYMYYDFPIPIDNTVNRRLVAMSQPRSFNVMRAIFPDTPKMANDAYMAQATAYLVGLHKERGSADWLPAWLSPRNQVNADFEPIVKFFLRQCLTYFADYEPYRVILLAACAARRIAKIYAITNSAVQKLSKELHALARHTLAEISWGQAVTSQEGQLIQIIGVQTDTVMADFVRRFSGEQKFLLESAKLQLREYWELEKRLLAHYGNYPELLRERSLGEMRMTEWSSVTYDNLGLGMLCRLHRFPEWKAYLLEQEHGLVETMAAYGSNAAKTMLGIEPQHSAGVVSDQDMADRFFFGDVATLSTLRTAYSGKAAGGGSR